MALAGLGVGALLLMRARVLARARSRFLRGFECLATRAFSLPYSSFFGAFFSLHSTVRALVFSGRLSIYPFLFNRCYILSISTSSISMCAVLHCFLLHFFSFLCTAMANPFDLNVRLEEDDDDILPFDLNEPIMEDHTTYGNVLSLFVLFLIFKATTCSFVSHFLSAFLDNI